MFPTYSQPWIHPHLLCMEKYWRKRLWSVSSCSVPWYKRPHVSNKLKIPTAFTPLESSESTGKCEVFMMTSELRNRVSFCLYFSWWDLFPPLWQTPFSRCVNCYNWVKWAANRREITNPESKHSLTSGRTRGALRLHPASCIRLWSHPTNKLWRRERESHSDCNGRLYQIKQNSTWIHLHRPFTPL